MGINQWALVVVRYSAGIVDWTMGEGGVWSYQIRRQEKLLKCSGLFHPCANFARLYLKRRGRGRGLISA